MRRALLQGIVVLLFCLTLSMPAVSQAGFTDNHTGSYFYLMGGFMNLDNDTNIRANTAFGGSIDPAFGFTYGHNITDWIAPELQFSYSTSTGNTPSGTGREHALTARLNAKYSFLTGSQAAKAGWKIMPYAKAGGIAHALFVNAPTSTDSIGAWGYGFGVGGGLEVNRGILYLGVDVSNDFIFLQDDTDSSGVPILDGGLDYQISVMGCAGIHF